MLVCLLFADMVELADTPDLGSGAVRHTGSSPAIRTKSERVMLVPIFFLLPLGLRTPLVLPGVNKKSLGK